MDALQSKPLSRFLVWGQFSLWGGLVLLSVGCSPAPESTVWESPSRRDSIVDEIELPEPFQAGPSQAEATAAAPMAAPASSPGVSPSISSPISPSISPPNLPPSQGYSLPSRSTATPARSTARVDPMPVPAGMVFPPQEFPPEVAAVETAATVPPTETSFQSVNVFYATDRKKSPLSLADFTLSGQRQLVSNLGIAAAFAAIFGALSLLVKRRNTAKLSLGLMVACSIGAVVVFATGRASIQKTGVTYTGERGQLVRGVCQVTIPKTHTRGSIERPSLFKLEINEDSDKHIVLTSVLELDPTNFETQLRSELDSAPEPDLLVFIHGYNVDFESAVHRTAQIAVDLPFAGVPVCYSWPSQGTLLGYPVDENNAAWTVGHLKDFLNDLVDRSGAKSIHVVAHSMGNRAMTSALQQIALGRGDSEPVFDRVVLAAPDVDADLFRKDLAPSLTRVANQVTLYASSDDQALIASKQVHGYPRAGETGEHLVIVDGVDTIDVSGIDLSLLGHSYYGDSEPMLRDLFDVLLTRLPASQRNTLTSRLYQSQTYWQLSAATRIATGPR